MRDDKWLFEKLDNIWDRYFPDVPQDNDVRIVWGRRARTRLGSIRQITNKSQISKFKFQNKTHNTKYMIHDTSEKHPGTLITINSLFKDEKIPEFVITATIAHEMAHYAHGFHSPLEQKHATPHAGGVIHKELRQRDLGALEKRQKKWLKENWREYIAEMMPQKTNRRRRLVIRWF